NGNDNSVTNSGLWGLRGWADSDGDGLRDLERIAISAFGGTADIVTNEASGVVALLATDGTDVGGAGVEEAVIDGIESFRNAGLITMADADLAVGGVVATTGDRLTIVGGFVGQDGALALDSLLNAGGSGNQQTDRFL